LGLFQSLPLHNQPKDDRQIVINCANPLSRYRYFANTVVMSIEISLDFRPKAQLYQIW